MKALLVALVLIALSACQATVSDPPRPTTTAVGVAADQALPGARWPVVQTRRIDVDGDGDREVVRLRHRERRQVPGAIRIEARLARGVLAVGFVRWPGLDFRLLRGVDLDADGDRELVLWREMGPREVTVLDLAGDRIAPVRHPERPYLASTYTRHRHARTWWAEGHHLYSTRSFEPFGGSSHYVETPARYAVRLWRWSLRDGALVADDLGRRCVRAAAPHDPSAC